MGAVLDPAGHRGNHHPGGEPVSTPITREHLADLAPEEINHLRQQGLLNHLLEHGGSTADSPTLPTEPTTGHTVADLAGMNAEDIMDKLKAGELDHLLTGHQPDPQDTQPAPARHIEPLTPDDIT